MEKEDLTFHQAYDRSVEFLNGKPHLLPIELALHPNGLWTLRVQDMSQDGDAEIAGFLMEVCLNG